MLRVCVFTNFMELIYLLIQGTFCPGRFDGFMCWPHGRAHSLVEAPCPSGIPYGEGALNLIDELF